MKPRRNPSFENAIPSSAPSYVGGRETSDKGAAFRRRGAHEAHVITNARTLRDSVREAIRAEVAPDGDSGFYRPSGNTQGDRYGSSKNQHNVVEWEKRARRSTSSSAELSNLRNQLEYVLRTQGNYQEEICRLLELPPHMSVETTKVPRPRDEYQEVRGFFQIRNQVLEIAKLPFAIEYPLSEKSELWLGGVTILPRSNPGLVAGLLEIIAREKQQTVVFAERFKESHYYVATARCIEGEFEKPFHLYRLVCERPRSMIELITDMNNESPTLKELLRSHRY
jgi:hypothetical protein